ncbi:MAG: phospho-N-acetylmuramoyl-pentapeptide-transferase [Clostridia bacterium]|nr:phospho-N-acetylmuramoyl-pentapeptide-transferase [Clostridia bacterium]
MEYYLLCFVACLVIGTIIAPFIINASKKFKASQTILHYVESHLVKQGTPTMGGLIFIITIMVSFCFFNNNYQLAVISLAVMLAYGTLGFLDDFIKIRYKRNEGLKPYQKIIGQGGIATIIAFYAYYSNLVGSNLVVPFTSIEINLGVFIVPIIIFVYLALVNSVNLTDGLDGLAGGVSSAYLLAFIALLVVYKSTAMNLINIYEYENLIVLCCCALGAIIAFLIFNVNKAKVFMGDTGSLALGGLLTSIAVFSKLTLLIPFIGIMFVLSALSVTIQVLYYKRTKKRIFLMAPLHHHFEKKGVYENRITFIYIVITIAVSSLIVAITLYAGGF